MSSESALRDRSGPPPAARAVLVAAAIAVVVGGIVVAILLLRGGSAATTASSPARTLTPPSVLSPRFRGLALAGHAGDVLVGVGARRGGPVDVVVVPSDGSPVRPADVRVSWRGRVVSGTEATECGAGCLRFPLHVLGGIASSLVVDVGRAGKDAARVPLRLPAQMPASADEVFRKARAGMLELPALGMEETLGSGLSKPVVSSWSFQAPDRMSYSIAGGAKAVVIGTRRWDDFGNGWQESASPRLQVPTFPWKNARAARRLGTSTLGGAPVSEVAAWLPAQTGSAPAWFVLDVARDSRVLRSRMLTTAHFMTDTYRDFGSVSPIRPPR